MASVPLGGQHALKGVVCAAAMDQLAKNLACEWASAGIRVNSVKPWFAPLL